MSARPQSQQPLFLQAQQMVPPQYQYTGIPMQMLQQVQMPRPFQTPDQLQATQQAQISPQDLSFESQFLTIQSQLEKVQKQLQAEELEKDRAEKRAEEAERNTGKARLAQKESQDAAKQLQIQKQQVENEAIGAVRLAKSQVVKAHEEVQDLEQLLREARADLIQAKAAKTVAEELVARREAEQAAQAQSQIDRTMIDAQQKTEEAQELTAALR